MMEGLQGLQTIILNPWLGIALKSYRVKPVACKVVYGCDLPMENFFYCFHGWSRVLPQIDFLEFNWYDIQLAGGTPLTSWTNNCMSKSIIIHWLSRSLWLTLSLIIESSVTAGHVSAETLTKSVTLHKLMQVADKSVIHPYLTNVTFISEWNGVSKQKGEISIFFPSKGQMLVSLWCLHDHWVYLLPGYKHASCTFYLSFFCWFTFTSCRPSVPAAVYCRAIKKHSCSLCEKRVCCHINL